MITIRWRAVLWRVRLPRIGLWSWAWLAGVGALIMLANLSSEVVEPPEPDGVFPAAVYGWPFPWIWLAIETFPASLEPGSVVRMSFAALAMNMAVWCVLLLFVAFASTRTARALRRSYQFSVRNLMLATTGCCLLLGALHLARCRAARQDVIIRSIQAQGGGVFLAHWGPDWLGVLGCDRLRRTVTGVSFAAVVRDEFDSEALVPLCHLPKLQRLELSQLPLGCADVDLITQIGTLTELFLDGTELDDQCIQRLGALRRLKELHLEDTGVGDDALASISQLSELVTLNLSSTKVHGSGLRHLEALRKLRNLDLAHCALDDKWAADVGSLRQLTELYLTDTPIGDVTARSVAQLQKLQILDITDTNVTSAGIEVVCSLPALRLLGVSPPHLSTGAGIHAAGPGRRVTLDIQASAISPPGRRGDGCVVELPAFVD